MRLSVKQQLIVSNLKMILNINTWKFRGRVLYPIKNDKSLRMFSFTDNSLLTFPIRNNIPAINNYDGNGPIASINKSKKFYDAVIKKEVPNEIMFSIRLQTTFEWRKEKFFKISSSEFLRGMFHYYDLWDEDQWIVKLNGILIGEV